MKSSDRIIKILQKCPTLSQESNKLMRLIESGTMLREDVTLDMLKEIDIEAIISELSAVTGRRYNIGTILSCVSKLQSVPALDVDFV
jgi:vacuolar-type H+-ATPase subunit C/Vma6